MISNIVERDDEASFSKLFKLMYERLVNFSKHYVQSRELAEEIVSDVFVKLWNNRKQADQIQNFESYMYVAVKNQSLNHISKTPYSFVEISDTQSFDLHNLIDVFDPAKELEAQELQHTIKLAIDTLPSQCKVIFKMIKEDGFKYKEVADILNISPRTVETQLVRAIKRLDVHLSHYMEKKIKKTKSVFNYLLSLYMAY